MPVYTHLNQFPNQNIRLHSPQPIPKPHCSSTFTSPNSQTTMLVYTHLTKFPDHNVRLHSPHPIPKPQCSSTFTSPNFQTTMFVYIHLPQFPNHNVRLHSPQPNSNPQCFSPTPMLVSTHLNQTPKPQNNRLHFKNVYYCTCTSTKSQPYSQGLPLNLTQPTQHSLVYSGTHLMTSPELRPLATRYRSHTPRVILLHSHPT